MKQLFNIILKQIEEELSKLELNTEIFKCFDPILWIETNEKLFFLSIVDLSANYSKETYILLLNELNDQFKKIANADKTATCEKLQTPALLTLILWEIIYRIPIKSNNFTEEIADIFSNFVTFDYSQIHYSSIYISLFKKLCKKVIKASNFVGTSVIKKVFSTIEEKKIDSLLALKLLSISLCSLETFEYFLSNTEKLIANVNKTDKSVFFDQYYNVASHFFTNFPEVYHNLVLTGLNDAFNLFVSLSKNKIIESHLLPILSLLITIVPPNTFNDKSKKNIHPILKAIQGFGPKKDITIQTHCITAFLELSEGLFFAADTESEPFSTIKKFYDKNIKDFENLLKSSLMDHPDENFLSSYARYATYLFISRRENCLDPLKLIQEKATSSQNFAYWSSVIEFYIVIFTKWSHHPKRNEIITIFRGKQKGEEEKIFLNALNGAFQICNSCSDIINKVLEDAMCQKFFSKLMKLFQFTPITFSIYSSFELQYREYTEQNPIMFPYTILALYKDGVEIKFFIKFLLRFISMSYKVKENTIILSSACFRNIWTFDKKTIEGKDNKTILSYVSEIINIFYETIKGSMDEFFDGVTYYSIYPYLFYRFLHWSYCALKETVGPEISKSSKSMSYNNIQNFLNASLIIHAISSDEPSNQLANNCDRIIREIIKLYNPYAAEANLFYYKSINEYIKDNENLFTGITGELFNIWLKFVKKQIENAGRSLFNKGEVNEEMIRNAFLASSLESKNEPNAPNSALAGSTLGSDLSRSLSFPNNIEKFLYTHFINIRTRKILFNSKLISSITKYLCKFDILKNDVFYKLINKVNFSSNIHNMNGANESNDVFKEFFSSCLSYINSLTCLDISFTSSFSALSDLSIPIFIDRSKSKLLKRVQNFQYDRPYFWLNFIHICITLASRPKITEEIIMFINDVIPIFFSTVEFNVFPINFSAQLMNSICNLISTFYDYIYSDNEKNQIFNPSILYSKQRLTTYSILEICINFASSDQKTFFNVLPTVLRTLASLFKNLNLDVTMSNNNVDDVTSENRLVSDVIFFMSFFNLCLQQTQDKEIITGILKCMNYIIHNNPSSWPIYSHFANNSSQLFKALSIESLTLVCGSIYHSQTDFESMRATTSTQVTHDPKDKILKSQREKMEVNYLLYEIKKTLENESNDNKYDIFNLVEPFPYKELTQPFETLTKNNFEFFKTLKFFNLRFLESCISCVVFYNLHDNLFEEMVKLVKPGVFDSVNCVSAFFNSWLLYAIRHWQLVPLINSVSSKDINAFIDIFCPPPFFSYYVSKFAKLTSSQMCKDMFLKCFLQPLIYCPLKYDVKKYISHDDAENFLVSLVNSPRYNRMLALMFDSGIAYPEIIDNYFPVDRHLVLSFISKKPKAIDHLFGMINQKAYDEIFYDCNDDSKKLSLIQDINFLSLSKWIKEAGTDNGCRVVYIKISQIHSASPSSIVNDFFYHFPKEDNRKIKFLIDLSTIPDKESIFEAFQKITEVANDQFTSKIEKVYLINPSMDTTQLLNDRLRDIISMNWVKKYEIVSDISKIIPKDSNIYLPISLFGNKSEEKYSFNTKYNNEMASFSICNDCFILSTSIPLFNINVLNGIRFPISSIESLKEVNDNKGCCVIIQTHSRISGQKKYRIETEHSKAILNIYNLLNQKCNFGHSCSLNTNTGNNDFISEDIKGKIKDILLSTSPSLQVQMLAFSIFQLSSTDSIKALGFQVYQLFESAFNLDKETGFHLTKSLPFDQENLINLTSLFNKIEKKSTKLLEAVAFSVSRYLSSSTTSESLLNLIPLFVKFVNISKNKASIGKVLINILKTSRKQPHISYLERFFFSKFNNSVAFQITIPILIRFSKGIRMRDVCRGEVNRTENTIENEVIEMYLQSLMNSNPKLVCEIIESSLNNAISKRSFGNLLTMDKIFSTMSSLPFHSQEFLSNNLGLFFYCSLLEGIYDSPGIITYTRKCYNMIFSLLIHVKGETITKMVPYTQNILKLIENPRILRLNELISNIDQLLTLLDHNQHDTFRQLLSTSNDDHNLKNWYIKGFAEVFFGEGNLSTAKSFVKMMPELYISEAYGFQKLAICFDSFEILIRGDRISNDKTIPAQLFWVSLIASTHPNTRIRESSLQLLRTIMNYLYTKSENKDLIFCVSEVTKARISSKEFDSIINEFENLMEADFNKLFEISIITILIKGTCGTDMESRKSPIEFFKWCFESFKTDLRTSLIFILPLFIFDTSFYYTSTTYSVSSPTEISSFISNSEKASMKILSWANSIIGSAKFNSLQEIVFYEFDDRSEAEKNWIVSFLERFFGESSCPYCVGVIADILLYGVDNFGSTLCKVNKSILDKCQSMIDNVKSIDGIEKLSSIAAAFVKASSVNTETQLEDSKDVKLNYRRAEKDKISSLIMKIINEISKLNSKKKKNCTSLINFDCLIHQ